MACSHVASSRRFIAQLLENEGLKSFFFVSNLSFRMESEDSDVFWSLFFTRTELVSGRDSQEERSEVSDVLSEKGRFHLETDENENLCKTVWKLILNRNPDSI